MHRFAILAAQNCNFKGKLSVPQKFLPGAAADQV
jgi:hypothetical protein